MNKSRLRYLIQQEIAAMYLIDHDVVAEVMEKYNRWYKNTSKGIEFDFMKYPLMELFGKNNRYPQMPHRICYNGYIRVKVKIKNRKISSVYRNIPTFKVIDDKEYIVFHEHKYNRIAIQCLN